MVIYKERFLKRQEKALDWNYTKNGAAQSNLPTAELELLKEVGGYTELDCKRNVDTRKELKVLTRMNKECRQK
jgi:hypothetical protein